MSRKFFSLTLPVVLAATILAGPAVGQDKKQQDSKQDRAAAGATRDAPVAGAMPLELTVEQKALVVKGWRASQLIGANVYNDKDESIGKIEDMIVSPDGKLSVAVIEVGGFLGIGKRRVAIPVDHFADIKAKRLVLPGATKEALKALPDFQYA